MIVMSTGKMRVHEIKVNGKPRRDTFYTLKPLNFALKLVGLNCIYRDGATLKYVWSLPKITFLVLLFGLMNAYNLYNKLVIWNGRVTFQFKDAIQVVFLCGYFQYLFDLFHVYKYGRYNALHYFDIYEKIDKVLSVNNYGEIRTCINILLISFALVTFTTSAIDFSAWFVTLGPVVIVAYIIDYFYVVIRNLSFAEVIAQVVQISFRLRVIGDLLKGFYLLCETKPGEKDIIADKYGMGKGWKNKVSNNKPGKTMDHYTSVIKQLNGCYLMILEQSDYINNMYGIRILGTCLTTFIDVVMTLNLGVRIAMGTLVQVTAHSSGVFPVVSSLVRVLSSGFILFYEVYRCEKCYYQIDRIVRYIDYLLVNKQISFDTRETLTSLRSLVVSRPVRFHAVNFYKLDCALMLSFGSAVVTYTMILLQNLQ